jgi:hypothetical protein
MKSLLLSALALLIVPAAAGAAKPRQVTCLVKSNGVADYRGPCRFTPDSNGSFAVDPVGRRSFPGGTSTVSLQTIAPGVAEVRGLTREGVNSRWGEARRSPKDRACWIGADFTVCAR